jgi:hypothetical protein
MSRTMRSLGSARPGSPHPWSLREGDLVSAAPDPAFVALLADQLRHAVAAHLAYQEQHGPVAEWPQWYAHYLNRTLGDVYREEDLLAALLEAASARGAVAQQTDVPDEVWPEWYAEHMAARLSREWHLRQSADDTGWDG